MSRWSNNAMQNHKHARWSAVNSSCPASSGGSSPYSSSSLSASSRVPRFLHLCFGSIFFSFLPFVSYLSRPRGSISPSKLNWQCRHLRTLCWILSATRALTVRVHGLSKTFTPDRTSLVEVLASRARTFSRPSRNDQVDEGSKIGHICTGQQTMHCKQAPT